MDRLQDKIALVTGGSSGIGLAVAQRFAKEGARLFITGRRQGRLDEAVATIDGQVEAIVGDMADPCDLDQVFAHVADRGGRLDVLVLNAGISEPSPLAESTRDHYDRTFDLNVASTLFAVQKAVPLMGPGSTIVLIGSLAGSVGTPGYGVYAASKAAMRSFARTWTSELAARGIRVNTLSPGPIETPMFDTASDDVREAMVKLVPLGRLGQPEEVASAALFLASSESSFIAGAELFIDGGMGQV